MGRTKKTALPDSEDRLSQIIYGSPIPTFVIDHQHRITHWNRAFENLTGLSREDAIGSQSQWRAFYASPQPVLADFIVDNVPEKTISGRYGATCRRSSVVEGAYEVESFFPDLGENGKWLFFTASPLHDAEGNINGAIETLQDITERKILEEEAMRAAHLASIGELAAGVAHEINNPITGIINCAQMLVDQSVGTRGSADIPRMIIEEGERIARIVSNLLSFARQKHEEFSPAPVHTIIADSLSLLEMQVRKDGIDLVVNVPRELPAIKARRQQVQQVFMNIISNARYALNLKFKKNGATARLEIISELVTIEKEEFVRTVFYDNGIGMAPDIINKVCNPFFSTKPGGEGTGLGLSISYGIIKDHGGRLRFESRQGEYTRVIVELPTARES